MIIRYYFMVIIHRENLEADSLVEVLRHVIPFMSKRWKVHFTY